MRRFLFGLLYVLHGLAHVFGGIRWQDVQRRPVLGTSSASEVVGTLLFALATTGFVQAGLGAWGLVGMRRIWRPLARLAVAASLLLLLFFIMPSLRLTLGIFLDIVALLLADPMALEGDHRQRLT